MIRNTPFAAICYFYPLGNTSAFCLTEDLPPEFLADVLLLGCGDWRHILFTCFADPGRKLDITCNDIEPDILARNVLLFSLILLPPSEDDIGSLLSSSLFNSASAPHPPKKTQAQQAPKLGKTKKGRKHAQAQQAKSNYNPCSSGASASLSLPCLSSPAFEGGNDGLTDADAIVWEIWFHQRLTRKAAAVLECQARRLCVWSETAESWTASPLGRLVRFCDTATRAKLRRTWRLYFPPEPSASTETSGPTNVARAAENPANAVSVRDGVSAVFGGPDDIDDRSVSIQGVSGEGSGLSEESMRMKRRWEQRLEQGHRAAVASAEGVISSMVLQAACSAAPVQMEAMQDLNDLRTHWWKTGGTLVGAKIERLNPTFFALTRPGLVLHYGTDPLTGFPSAHSYLALESDEFLSTTHFHHGGPSPKIGGPKKGGPSSHRLLWSCRRMFSQWTVAVRAAAAASNLVVRVVAADALRLCATLIHARETALATGKLEPSANLHCDFLDMTPFVLLPDEYQWRNAGKADGENVRPAKVPPAPLTFNVIDTSNILDWSGAWHLLPVTAPLLRRNIAATLYVESLLSFKDVGDSQMERMLGVDLRTASLLLGVSPVELWTFATTANEETLFLRSMHHMAGSLPSQHHCRLRWKRFLSLPPTGMVGGGLAGGLDGGQGEWNNEGKVRMDKHELVEILYKIFQNMFHHESTRERTTNLKNLLKERPCPYNRTSFVALVKTLKQTVDTDWSAEGVPRLLYDRIADGSWDSMVNFNYIQELILAMHMTGLTSQENMISDLPLCFSMSPASIKSRFAQSHFDAPRSALGTSLSRDEAYVPGAGVLPIHVALTIQVPAERLSKIAAKVSAKKMNQPTFEIVLMGGNETSNHHLCLQAALGRVVPVGTAKHKSINDRLTIEAPTETGDNEAGFGRTDLILSAYVQSATALYPNTSVVCGFLQTLQSASYITDGFLPFYTVPISHPSVFLTRFMPGMTGYPFEDGQTPAKTAKPTATASSSRNFAASFTGTTYGTGSVQALVAKVDMRTQAAAANLFSDPLAEVRVNYEDPHCAQVSIKRRSSDVLTPATSSRATDTHTDTHTDKHTDTHTATHTDTDAISFPVVFPMPVDFEKRKLRIARKSSYIEIEAPLRIGTAPILTPKSCFISPLFMASVPTTKLTPRLVPVPYTNRRLCLDQMPRLDLPIVSRSRLLESHLNSGGCPALHKKRRDEKAAIAKGSSSAPAIAKDLRVDIDTHLMCMLIAALTDSEAKNSPAFALGTAENVEIWIFPSCMRLDLLNHTVVMDAAVLCAAEAIPVAMLAAARGEEECRRIICSAEEIQCWKKCLLPSMVERCRDYEHTDTCEYTRDGRADSVTAVKAGWENMGSTSLCSCGLGRFPPNYFKRKVSSSSTSSSSGPDCFGDAVKKFAHRCAVGPLFASFFTADKELQQVFDSVPHAPKKNQRQTLAAAAQPRSMKALQEIERRMLNHQGNKTTLSTSLLPALFEKIAEAPPTEPGDFLPLMRMMLGREPFGKEQPLLSFEKYLIERSKRRLMADSDHSSKDTSDDRSGDDLVNSVESDYDSEAEEYVAQSMVKAMMNSYQDLKCDEAELKELTSSKAMRCSKEKKGATAAIQCANCGSEERQNGDAGISPLLSCGRCKRVRYCSIDCQKSDWPSHKRSCA